MTPNAKTLEPVTLSGWYEQTDGRIAKYRWSDGELICDRTVASWKDVPAADGMTAIYAWSER